MRTLAFLWSDRLIFLHPHFYSCSWTRACVVHSSEIHELQAQISGPRRHWVSSSDDDPGCVRWYNGCAEEQQKCIHLWAVWPNGDLLVPTYMWNTRFMQINPEEFPMVGDHTGCCRDKQELGNSGVYHRTSRWSTWWPSFPFVAQGSLIIGISRLRSGRCDNVKEGSICSILSKGLPTFCSVDHSYSARWRPFTPNPETLKTTHDLRTLGQLFQSPKCITRYSSNFWSATSLECHLRFSWPITAFAAENNWIIHQIEEAYGSLYQYPLRLTSK